MAALSSRCCLNLPRLADSNSIPLAKSSAKRVKIDEKKRKCKLGMGLAWTVIGALEMATSTPNIELILHPEAAAISMATEIVTTKSAAGKWSDRRAKCPSWNTNALETIVPEKLPRPSSHRTSEAVAFQVQGCFSM